MAEHKNLSFGLRGVMNLTVVDGQPQTPSASTGREPLSSIGPPVKPIASLLFLPAELIQQILESLCPVSLATLAQTCHLLHTHTYDESLWRRFVQEQTPSSILRSPSPCNTFRELYARFQPYWFLPKASLSGVIRQECAN